MASNWIIIGALVLLVAIVALLVASSGGDAQDGPAPDTPNGKRPRKPMAPGN